MLSNEDFTCLQELTKKLIIQLNFKAFVLLHMVIYKMGDIEGPVKIL